MCDVDHCGHRWRWAPGTKRLQDRGTVSFPLVVRLVIKFNSLVLDLFNLLSLVCLHPYTHLTLFLFAACCLIIKSSPLLSHPPPSSPTSTPTVIPWAWSSWASCASWASRPVRTSPTTATAPWPGPTKAPRTTTKGRCTSWVPTTRSWAMRPTRTSKPWSMAALWVHTHKTTSRPVKGSMLLKVTGSCHIFPLDHRNHVWWTRVSLTLIQS